MDNILIYDGSVSEKTQVFTKKSSLHIKEFDFSSVKSGDCFSIEEVEDKLVASVVEESGSQEEPVYTILCDEFGLIGLDDSKAKARISFFDGGYMAVTLIEGVLLVKLNDTICMVTRGVDDSDVKFDGNDSIYWVNSDKLLSFSKYWTGLKSRYVQDFEYMFILSGQGGSLSSFRVQRENESDIDISGGHIASIEREMEVKAESKRMQESLSNVTKSSGGFEFDDDDEDDDYLEEEDDYYDEDEY